MKLCMRHLACTTPPVIKIQCIVRIYRLMILHYSRIGEDKIVKQAGAELYQAQVKLC
jgi:hypothetical protein